MMPSFLCLGWVPGHCSSGLMLAGGAQPVPAFLALPLSSGKMPQVTLNSQMHLMGKEVVSSLHSFAVSLVCLIFLLFAFFLR